MRLASLVLALSVMQAGGSVAHGQTLAPGMELMVFQAGRPTRYGNGRITVLRVDPTLWQIEILGGRGAGEALSLTAKEWSERNDLAAAINAGMFAADRQTHVGYLRVRGHVINGKVNRYRSVAAFDPRRARLPRFRMYDLDAPGVSMQGILGDYASAVQNLRLIKRPRENRWPPQDREWSEAALGEDRAGRLLFIFSRQPRTMHDLNEQLLSLDIDLVCAQHLEGGPEAQLSVRAGGADIEMFGTYATFLQGNDESTRAWPIPNVIGLRPRAARN